MLRGKVRGYRGVDGGVRESEYLAGHGLRRTVLAVDCKPRDTVLIGAIQWIDVQDECAGDVLDMNCKVNNVTHVKNVIRRGTREESQIILAQAKRDRSTHSGLTVKEREWKTVTASIYQRSIAGKLCSGHTPGKISDCLDSGQPHILASLPLFVDTYCKEIMKSWQM